MHAQVNHPENARNKPRLADPKPPLLLTELVRIEVGVQTGRAHLDEVLEKVAPIDLSDIASSVRTGREYLDEVFDCRRLTEGCRIVLDELWANLKQAEARIAGAGTAQQTLAVLGDLRQQLKLTELRLSGLRFGKVAR